jgi:hypothetical protein
VKFDIAIKGKTAKLTQTEDGGWTVTLPKASTEFTLTVTVTDPVPDQLEWKTTTGGDPPLKGEPTLKDGVLTATFSGVRDGAAFQAVGKAGDAAEVKSMPVTISAPTVAVVLDDGKGGDQKVVEVEVGEFSRAFAVLSFIPLFVVIVGVVGLAGWIGLQVGIPALTYSTGDEVALVPLGTISERVGAVVVLVTTAVGTALLLFGTWFAALEVRGRLRLNPKVGVKSLGVPISLKDLAPIVDAASKLRGTIAVILAGTLVLLGSLWGVTGIDPSTPNPTETGATDDGAEDDPAGNDPAGNDPAEDDTAAGGDGPDDPQQGGTGTND